MINTRMMPFGRSWFSMSEMSQQMMIMAAIVTMSSTGAIDCFKKINP